MSGITLHVIYGIPCAGKSTAALRFAAENGIRTIIHTDYLREVQRLYASPDKAPALAHVSHTAWEMSGDRSPDGIATGFAGHAAAVFPAVQAVTAKLARDGLNAVIEGSHFHGTLITQLRRRCPAVTIRPVLVTVESLTQLLEHIDQKERERASNCEPKGWKASAPHLMVIQDFLISDAARHAIPLMPAAGLTYAGEAHGRAH